MRLHRFYTQTPITSNEFDIADKELVHQWKKVFRYNVGSQVIMFDGTGTEHICLISRLGAAGVTLSALKTREIEKPHKNVTLCMSIIKKDNFELVVQKATELGVHSIIPILSEHSEKKKVNMERLRKIAIEASEQSGRGDVPEILPTTTLTELFKGGILPQEKIAFHVDGISISKYFSTMNPDSIAVFIGPEGGWSEAEIREFGMYNIPCVRMGTQILRAETAAFAAVSLLLID